MNRLALTDDAATAFERAALAAHPSETGAFYLLRSGAGATGVRLVASDPYFPTANEWDRLGPNQLAPSARLLSAMVSRAERARAGLLFVHSHPDPRHPTGFSTTDMEALDSLAEVLPDILDGPFGAGVVGPNGWVATVRRNGDWDPVSRVTAAGRSLRSLNLPPSKPENELDDRQARALGAAHRRLRGLDVALVGCGGLGSPVAEILVRMGVHRLVLIDHDRLDTPSNVRRIFGSRLRDLERQPFKAELVGEHCRSLGLDTQVRHVVGDVRNPEVFAHLLDVDVVLCATDTHSSRAVLDAAASAFHLPVIDGGVRVGVRSGSILDGLVSEVRIVAPGLPCLWCGGTLSAEQVRQENLPDDARNRLRREGYVAGVDAAEGSVAALTVLGAGMMTCALLAMLAEDSTPVPARMIFDGFHGDSPPVPAARLDDSCICRARLGMAMSADLGLVPNTHPAQGAQPVLSRELETDRVGREDD